MGLLRHCDLNMLLNKCLLKMWLSIFKIKLVVDQQPRGNL